MVILFELLFEHYTVKINSVPSSILWGNTEVSTVRFYSLVIFGCILTALSFGCGDGDGDASANNGAAPAQSCSGQSVVLGIMLASQRLGLATVSLSVQRLPTNAVQAHPVVLLARRQ